MLCTDSQQLSSRSLRVVRPELLRSRFTRRSSARTDVRSRSWGWLASVSSVVETIATRPPVRVDTVRAMAGRPSPSSSSWMSTRWVMVDWRSVSTWRSSEA